MLLALPQLTFYCSKRFITVFLLGALALRRFKHISLSRNGYTVMIYQVSTSNNPPRSGMTSRLYWCFCKGPQSCSQKRRRDCHLSPCPGWANTMFILNIHLTLPSHYSNSAPKDNKYALSLCYSNGSHLSWYTTELSHMHQKMIS